MASISCFPIDLVAVTELAIAHPITSILHTARRRPSKLETKVQSA